MQKKLTKMLHMKREPVGIYFANTTAVCDMDADPKARNCVIPMLMKASEGKIISMDEKSCNCAGGATGCCFGDGFEQFYSAVGIDHYPDHECGFADYWIFAHWPGVWC